MALRSIELFAGGGGLALGLHRLGIESVVYVERDFFAASIVAKAIEEGRLPPASIHSDVCTFDGRPWRGRIQIVSAGFPCQDISNAGKRLGITGTRSGLWKQFARIIEEVDPDIVFMENVAALIRRGLDVVLTDLAALGFDAEWGVFRASDAGAPHRRERVFILAYAKGCCEPILPGFNGGQPAMVGSIAGTGGRVIDGDPASGVQRAGGVKGCLAGAVDQSFPPGVVDAVGWSEYIQSFPGTEPALCRGADGLAHRMDRLRVLGNGVVPQQAELAFRVLWRRVIDG